MRRIIRPIPGATLAAILILGTSPDGRAQGKASALPGPAAEAGTRLPTLFLIGDSTVNTHSNGQLGWGDPIAGLFDPARIRVQNRARGGRSSRTFRSEGLWEKVLADAVPGDFVLIQFGHNDGGSPTQGRARASLKGNGDETVEVPDPKGGKAEVVHTYGWYIRQYASEARAKGVTPIVLSPIPRNIWKDGRTVVRASGDYGRWAAEAAEATGARFIDLNERVARRYEEDGHDKVKSQYFVSDHTHTSPAGARLNAEAVLEGIRGLPDCPLRECLRNPPDAEGKP